MNTAASAVQNLDEVQISFASSNKAQTLTRMTLKEAIDDIRSDKYKAQIKQAMILYRQDKPAYDALKSTLPAFIFGGTFGLNQRKASCLENHSGIINIDIDKLSSEVERQRIFNLLKNDPTVIFAFYSPSYAGIKAGVRIEPVKGQDEYKQAFAQISTYWKTQNVELDRACSDVSRLCYVSCHPKAHYNPEAQVFEIDYTIKATTGATTAQNLDELLDSLPAFKATPRALKLQEQHIETVTSILYNSVAGERHAARGRAAKLAGGFVAAGRADGVKMFEALFKASDEIMDQKITPEKRAIEENFILSAFEAGLQEPIQPATSTLPTTYLSEDDEEDITLGVSSQTNKAIHDLSDLGIARRILDNYGKDIRFINKRNKWIYWKDGSWKLDDGSRYVQSLVIAIKPQLEDEFERINAEEPMEKEVAKAWRSRISALGNTKVRLAVLSALESQTCTLIEADDLDSQPTIIAINDSKTIVDLKTGMARPAARKDLATMSANVKNLGDSSKAKYWKKFVGEIFNNDAHLVDWYQRWTGYLLTGLTKEQVIMCQYGVGRNGKSLSLETIAEIMGAYHTKIPSSLLLEYKKSPTSATPHVAKMKGRRLITCSETSEGSRLDAATVKELSGDAKLEARNLHEAPIEFRMQGKIVFSTNHKPTITDTSLGMWERVLLLPFTQIFTGAKQDPTLADKFAREFDHIFAWMVEGAVRYFQEGLKSDLPELIKSTTETYRKSQDWFAEFVEESIINDPSSKTTVTEVYNRFTSWAKEYGLPHVPSKKTFRNKLVECGFNEPVKSTGGAMFWKGIGLTDSAIPTI